MTLINSLKAELIEYQRPWKLATLSLGIMLLVLGSFYYQAPDWDIPISFIMAFFAYLSASWSLHVMVERHWRYFPVMLFFTWFTVVGCYALYWYFKDPVTLAYMREVNFLASLSLYWMCGLVWYFRGNAKEFIKVVFKYSAIKNN